MGKLKYTVKIWLNEESEEVKVNAGDNLLKVLYDAGYEISSYCGGQGICGKCKVKLLSGEHQLTEEEKDLLTESEIDNRIRLACLIDVEDDLEVELEVTEDIIALTGGLITESRIDHEFHRTEVKLKEPSLSDQRDFLQRVHDQLDTEFINYSSLRKLDEIDKTKPITVTYSGKNVVQLAGGKKKNDVYGLAVDIGTTTVVLYLLNLRSGEEVDVYSLYNPQKKYGADVISRINFTQKEEEGQEILQNELLSGLNEALEEMLATNSLTSDDIVTASMVGNTIMLHTLLGLNAESIARTPYIPLFTNQIEIEPGELGLDINRTGSVFVLPAISGYIGADIVADMLAVDINSRTDSINLMIDIGTNGEMVLSTGDSIYACSTAAGPAFEGANISYGMAGIPGAISHFSFDVENEKIKYKTIKNKKPRGICGSGLLDIVAELYRAGIIDSRGGFVDEEKMTPAVREYMTEYKDMRAFRVAPAEESNNDEDILLTQKDVRELQLAKGAIQAGIKILRKKVEIECTDIDRVFIAGGFGNYIDPHNACVINLIPEELEEKIVQIGNGAGTGAKIYLLDKKARSSVRKIRERVNYIELSSRQDFQAEFMDSMPF
ncbi:MAG: ASKHA domain-containing protein [Halanaerobiales bacterium]